MLHEKHLLDQFLAADKQPLPAATGALEQLQSLSSWEYFNVGLGLLSRDMELVSYNSSFCDLTGLPPETVLKSNFYGIFSMKPAAIGAVRSTLETDGSWSGKVKLGERSLRIAITSLQGSDPTLATSPLKAAFSVVLIDYTEEFRQLQLLSEAKFQAEKTDRAKSQFLSHMSHELRTPLNAILGFSQLLSMDDTLTDMQMDNVREIEGAGEYLLSLINEILDLSRIEAGRIELQENTIDFESLLNECFALVKPLAENKQIHLEYRLHDHCLLRNDHVRLKQILINLLSNAIKYNQAGGRVLVQCKATETSVMRIEILDTGNGIHNELLPYIFTPFERLGAESRHIEGTGIGLMITRRLVKLMKGDIGVISRSGAGSLFWIDLPMHIQQDGAILARGDHYSSLFDVTPVFGLGPSDSRTFRMIADLCSIRTSLTFQHDHKLEVLAGWMQQHRHGHVILHASLLPLIAAAPSLMQQLARFSLVIVNDDQVAMPASAGLTGNEPTVVTRECKFADLPMVLLDSTESCKVIRQCN
ncbi:MAG TPA: HAMP domain-containing sensor histidine kinase [Candidatus Acidoferrum sp.]|nr:HAMP domain-containing sensor histidine kinase [Candidatus Acidoferrum sp.]